MLSSNCAVCSGNKSRLINEQEASGLSFRLRIRAPLSEIPLIGSLLF